MARIEWVKLRLNNWALWKAREAGNGLGFASTSSFLREADTSRYRESIIPVDETDASVTNDAVESLKSNRAQLYECLQVHYVCGPGGIRATAKYLCCSESTVKSLLDQADIALSTWFVERTAQQRARRDEWAKAK